MVPEVFEEMWQNLVHDVLWLYTIGAATLFHYLKENTKTLANTTKIYYFTNR